MNHLKWIFSSLVLFVSLESYSQGMKLGEAVDEAMAQSPKVQKSESQYKESSWKKTESYSGFLPSLSANASYLFNKKYALVDVTMNNTPLTIPQVVPTTNLYLTAQWSIFDGFSSTNRYLSAGAFEDSAKNEYDWTRFQVEREVVVLFYKALAAKELKAVAEQNVRALNDHLKDVRLFKKVGTSTNYDVLRVEVQMSEAQSELLNATDNVEVARARLSEALGQDQDVSEVEGVLPRLKPELVAKVTQFNSSERKDLQSLRQKAEGFRYQEDSAEKYWVPRLALIGQYQYYNNRNDRFDDYENGFRDAWQYGISLTWNIFDGMTSISRSKQSIEQKYQAEKTLRQAELKAKRDFDFWKRKYLYYCAVFEARQNDIAKSEESVRLSREGQKVGARTNTDVLDAEAELYRAKAGAVNAQIGAIEALVNLELSTGQKLVDFN
ncbi:outer membrane secretion protein [Bdellovibrio bacteriovorus]|uniref:Outer membrane secretion protein n=1 Tax=Bdellovibrio bacteriovorus TaxID=959 RepID=A0A162G9I2_BDEBC|nr:TolC family protein [Bdellovibrio bacteriovorus]KYG65357.1 outer membrane secretion protein [Bdellovibrio bacteriovorus]